MSSTRAALLAAALSLAAARSPAEEPPARVDAVRVDPAALVEKVELKELVLVKAPGPWDAAAVERTRQSLLATGRFATVEPAVTREGERTVLTFRVAPRPWVRRIEVEGSHALGKRTLLDRLDLKVWRPLPEDAVAKVPAQVVEAYDRSGLPPPGVEVEVGDPDARGATTVRLRLTEEPLPRLDSWNNDLDGLPWFTSLSTRGRLLYLKWGTKLSHLNRKTIDASLRKEQRRLRGLGWKGAAFRVEEEPGATEDSRAVKVTLDLGPREEVKGTGIDRPVLREATMAWKRRNVPLSEGVVNRLARVAKEGMVERGYTGVEVTAAEKREGTRRTIVLTGRHGPRLVVARLGFEGAASLPEAALRKAVPLHEPRFLGLSKSHPGPAVLEESRLAVTDLYVRSGFPDAKVSVRLEGEGTEQAVVFAVEEGKRRTVRPLTFPGATRLAPAELARVAKLKEGDPYWPEGATAAAEALKKEYARRGYDEATVTPRAGVADAEGHTPLAFDVVEGTAYVVGQRIVRGSVKTKVRRILSVGDERRGKPVDPRVLAEHQAHLGSLGVFDTTSVTSKAVPGSAPPEKTVLVDVAERQTGFYEWGLDLNTQRGLEVAGTLGERNLLGLATSGSVSALVGKERQSFTLEAGQPALFGTRLYNSLRATYTYDKTYPGFALQTMSAQCGFSWEFDPKDRLTLVYQVEDQRPLDVQPDVQAEDVPLEARIGSLTPTLSLDGRDDPFLTTKGTFFQVRVKASRKFLGGDSDFNRWELDGRWYRTYADFVTVAAALRFGYARGMGDTSLPVGERFYVGGASTHRGFKEKELGPRGSDGTPLGGESYALWNTELRFPLISLLEGGLFLDVGNAYLGRIDVTDLRWAAGVGLRLRTPIGPLRVDVGFKLDRQEGESPSVFHFALGHAF